MTRIEPGKEHPTVTAANLKITGHLIARLVEKGILDRNDIAVISDRVGGDGAVGETAQGILNSILAPE